VGGVGGLHSRLGEVRVHLDLVDRRDHRRLLQQGDTFRQRWARHEVRRHRASAKRLNHPLVGQLTFTYETMELAADQGLYLIMCGTAPGSPDADALGLLASWNATGNAETALKQT
jgi:hypothetical protein